MTIILWDKQGRNPRLGTKAHSIRVHDVRFDITGVKLCVRGLPDVQKHFKELGFYVDGDVKMSLGQFIDLVDKIIE